MVWIYSLHLLYTKYCLLLVWATEKTLCFLLFYHLFLLYKICEVLDAFSFFRCSCCFCVCLQSCLFQVFSLAHIKTKEKHNKSKANPIQPWKAIVQVAFQYMVGVPRFWPGCWLEFWTGFGKEYNVTTVGCWNKKSRLNNTIRSLS